jgi:hypothetical protein
MSKTLNCTYTKFDRFDNPVFIVGASCPEQYEKVCRYYKRLSARYTTNLPIYLNPLGTFATLRLKRDRVKLNGLSEGATYKIVFNFTEVESQGAKYINIVANSVRMIKPAVMATIVDLDSDDEPEAKSE